MSEYKNPRPSPSASASDPCVVYDNSVSFDKLINESEVVTTYKGVELQSVSNLLEQIEDEASAAIISLGWHQVGLFADGFTYTLQNDIAKDSLGDWYRWNGTLPKIVTAGTLPSSDANFVKIDYKSHADLTDRNPADGSAHNADDVAKNGGGTIQDFIDDLASVGSTTLVGGVTAGDLANNMIAPVLRGKSITPPIMTGLTPTRKSSLLKISDEQYRSYLHLGGRTWQISDFANSGLDAAGNTTPFGWDQTMVQDFAEAIIWGDAEVTSGAGTWTDLSTSDPNPYLGHRAAQATAIGAYVEISLQVNQGEADITLNFTGRNNGNIIDVTIDGSTALVNESTTVDTYTPVDLTHRQTKLVASGLPARVSPYLVRFTLSAAKNPSSLAGDRFIFSGLTIDGDSFGNPWSPNVRPKAWMPTTSYSLYQEVIGGGGRIYVCTVAGTSGAIIPSHTNGSATDGTVTWLLIARSAFITNTNRTDVIQAAGSQLEYAYEFRPTPSDPYQDVGGNLHGNEYLTAPLSVSVDGLVKTLQSGSYAVGHQVILNQKIRAYYGIVTAAPTDICDTSLTHSIGSGKIVVSHESKMLSDGNFGFHYPAMWPVVYFNGVTAKLVCPQMELAQTGRVDLIDYAGIVNPFVGATTDLQMRAIGEIYRPIGSGGVPSTGDGEYHCIMSLTVSNYGVGDYKYGSRLASIAPNLSGAVAPSGFSSWVGKMYFARSNTDKPEPVVTGQIIRSDNEYKISLFNK